MTVTTDVAVEDPVSRWERGLVLLAGLAALAAATAMLTETRDVLTAVVCYGPWVVVTCVPVLTLSRRSFHDSLMAIGMVEIVCGCIFAIIRWSIFIPIGLALVFLGFANGRRTRLCGALSLLISGANLSLWVVTLIHAADGLPGVGPLLHG